MDANLGATRSAMHHGKAMKGKEEVKEKTSMVTWISQLFSGKQTKSSAKKDRTRSGGRPIHSHSSSPSRGSFRAAMIYSRIECCDAAQRISGQKFLAAHAPRLPLGGCSQPELCQCRYKHLTDRRQEMRRDSDHGLPNRGYVQAERRSRSDRRRDKSPRLSA